MVHFVIQPAIVLVGNICQSRLRRSLQEFIVHTLNSLVVHATIHLFLATTLNPNLEHVFVRGISHGTKGDLVVGENGQRVSITKHVWEQAIGPGNFMKG
jgi:hypothetical protein